MIEYRPREDGACNTETGYNVMVSSEIRFPLSHLWYPAMYIRNTWEKIVRKGWQQVMSVQMTDQHGLCWNRPSITN
jgi:hypothetical protein